MSEQGCDLDLALIATEGRKAIDVLHVTKAGASSMKPRNALKHGWNACWRHLMKLVKSIVRPNKVDDVRDALEKLNVGGMTVTEVRGTAGRRGTPRSIAARSTTSRCCRRSASTSS